VSSISVDTRKYLALEKKRDKLQSRAKSATVEMEELRNLYDMVGVVALKLFDEAVMKKTIKAAEGA
jgi:hypothetical protein